MQRCPEVCGGVCRGMQRSAEVSLYLISLCGGVSLQLISLYRGVPLQLIRLCGGMWRGAQRGVQSYVEVHRGTLRCVGVCGGVHRGTQRCAQVCRSMQRYMEGCLEVCGGAWRGAWTYTEASLHLISLHGGVSLQLIRLCGRYCSN